MAMKERGGTSRHGKWPGYAAPWVFLMIWVFAGLTGCTNYNYALGLGLFHFSHPILNPLSSALVSEPDIERSPPRYGKVVLLLHGWRGDASSFGDLADLLQRDRIETHAVYSLSYWSNGGGPNFRKIGDIGESLADLLEATLRRHHVTDVSIVAHSMGGLIARDALLRLKDRKALHSDVTVRLILLATPTRGADLAIEYDKIIGGITAPLTFVISSVGRLFGSHTSLVWDRQAHDMRHLNVVNQQRLLAPVFIADQTLRWSEAWEPPVYPHLFAVIGVPKDRMTEPPGSDESDGVVRAVDVPFNHVADERRCYVAERHWDGIANITSRDHQVYRVIDAMLDSHDGKSSVMDACPADDVGRHPTWIVVVRQKQTDERSPSASPYRLELEGNDDVPETQSRLAVFLTAFMETVTEISYGFLAGPVLVEANATGSRHTEALGSFLINKSVKGGHHLRVKDRGSVLKAEFLLNVQETTKDCPPPPQAPLCLAHGETNMLFLDVSGVSGAEPFTLCDRDHRCLESLRSDAGRVVQSNAERSQ
jgi:pimeloyl-ACP methyl ester carboxylesterase